MDKGVEHVLDYNLPTNNLILWLLLHFGAIIVRGRIRPFT